MTILAQKRLVCPVEFAAIAKNRYYHSFVPYHHRTTSVSGHDAALVLNQIDYWLEMENTGIFHEGRKWIYNNIPSWLEQFGDMTVYRFRQAVKRLKELGVLIAKPIRDHKRDRTLYYSINYIVLSNLLQRIEVPESCNVRNSNDGKCEFQPMEDVSFAPSSIYTENTDRDYPSEINNSNPEAAAILEEEVTPFGSVDLGTYKHHLPSGSIVLKTPLPPTPPRPA